MFCDKCGTKNPENNRFCSNCGKPLSQQSGSHSSVSVSEIIMKFEGKNGQIDLYKDKLIIKRAGLWAVVGHGFTKGDKTIYLNQITGIQLKLGGLLVGYIQFTLPGGIESKKGVMAATEDENTVTFIASGNNLATKLKEKIEELKNKSSQSSTSVVQVSTADEITKFKHLLDEGIITKEEFDRKKKELLGL